MAQKLVDTLEELNCTLPEGEEVSHDPLKEKISITIVGSDSARCYLEAKIPVAVRRRHKAKAQRQIYRANSALGCGCNLPAILGADSMHH